MSKCSACRFFAVNLQDMKQGICHKEPPKLYPIPTQQGINIVPLQPQVGVNDWCGAFERKFDV